jgi:hypothetical protein
MERLLAHSPPERPSVDLHHHPMLDGTNYCGQLIRLENEPNIEIECNDTLL